MRTIIAGWAVSLVAGCVSSPSADPGPSAIPRTGIVGVVVDERGRPIPEATVLGDRNDRATTDEFGRFEFPKATEAADLSVTVDGYAGAHYFEVQPGSRLSIGLIHSVKVGMRLSVHGPGSEAGVRFDLKMTRAWGNPDLSKESGTYGHAGLVETEIEVRPGTYDATVGIAGLRIAEGKGFELKPGEPCLFVECKGIDWTTVAKAANLDRRDQAIRRDYFARMIKAPKVEQKAVWDEMRSKQEPLAEELLRLQEVFDASPRARIELRKRVEDF